MEAALDGAWCVVTATGIRHALAGKFDAAKLAASETILANMGVEDEFGPEIPEERVLNRGIGGDNINGLYFRLDEDIFPNSPRQVVINIGINGIERDFNDSIARLKFVAELMREHGIRVWCNSIAPLRAPDAWDRFQYQEKIVALNEVCRELFEREFAGFFDLHALLRDSSGQLAAEYAQPDGTHWTFAAYQAASKLLREKLLPEGKGKR